MRIINEAGLTIIKSFEKCILTAYLDQAGIPTVGWGHRIVAADGLQVGDTITDAQADALLAQDLTGAENIVSSHITADLNDNQFSACVAFAYNAGSAPFVGRFAELLNGGDYDGASSDFTHWDHVRVNGQLVVSNGLLRRCDAEAALFDKDDNATGGKDNG